MMHQVTLQEAAEQLTSLIDEARSGSEVVITEDRKPAVRLILIPEDKPRPKFGNAKDVLIFMADDFDAPLDEFQEYL
jgi:antitoxin (DNA-binding transcriptional repressor) of toxin-antitoxin stability system